MCCLQSPRCISNPETVISYLYKNHDYTFYWSSLITIFACTWWKEDIRTMAVQPSVELDPFTKLIDSKSFLLFKHYFGLHNKRKIWPQLPRSTSGARIPCHAMFCKKQLGYLYSFRSCSPQRCISLVFHITALVLSLKRNSWTQHRSDAALRVVFHNLVNRNLAQVFQDKQNLKTVKNSVFLRNKYHDTSTVTETNMNPSMWGQWWWVL